MSRAVNKDDELLELIKEARHRERETQKQARKELQQAIERATGKAHSEVISAIRAALVGGQSARQIGIAYGSSDPYTIRKLILEASINIEGGNPNHPDWIMTKNDNGSFSVQVMSLADTGLSGNATFTIDDDGENFTAIDGDLWMQMQLYRAGYRDAIIEEYNAQ